jgi:hypothetical protein
LALVPPRDHASGLGIVRSVVASYGKGQQVGLIATKEGAGTILGQSDRDSCVISNDIT